MGNRYPVNTEYFCGNCEEEVNGLPAGCRIHSGRPLCYRCTQIGVEEGWAEEQVLQADKRVYESTRKPGIMVLAFFVAVLAVVFAITMFAVVGWNRDK